MVNRSGVSLTIRPNECYRDSMSPRCDRPIGILRLVVDELERVDLGKMNLQLIANEENQDRTSVEK